MKHENILVYNISYKSSTGPKPLRIRLDKINEFIRTYGVIILTKLVVNKNKIFLEKGLYKDKFDTRYF